MKASFGLGIVDSTEALARATLYFRVPTPVECRESAWLEAAITPRDKRASRPIQRGKSQRIFEGAFTFREQIYERDC